MVKNYNIVIDASDEVSLVAREVSRFALEEIGGAFFELDESVHIPHLTLLHIALEESALPRVALMLESIAENFEPFLLRQDKYRLVDNRWLDMSYELDEPLMKLHQAVLAIIAPLRVRTPEGEQKEDWSDLSPERQENLELYGSAEVARLYRPHLTLTRFKEPREEALLEGLPAREFSFVARSLDIYELGEHGTCKNIVATCALGEKLL
ncbi:MAG: 2'-5' RNA ligase family protein [Candidatus Moranbacteria bacterium]|nr:2'-5' RNA ligase family protein [Candidatus Moranbacteria bacterium]